MFAPTPNGFAHRFEPARLFGCMGPGAYIDTFECCERVS
jgi:hypothetical protein